MLERLLKKKRYVFACLMRSEIGREAAEETIEAFRTIVESAGGEVTGSRIETDPTEPRRLSYPIRKKTTAVLATMTFLAEPETSRQFTERLRHHPHILRSFLTREELRIKRIRPVLESAPPPEPSPPPPPTLSDVDIDKKLQELIG